MNLSQNTILITGGTAGIGLSFTEEFLRRGNTVIICGRRADRLAQLREQHPGLVTFAADVSIAADREKLVKAVTEAHPDLNVLINNAGVQYYNDLAGEFNLEKAESEIATNLTAPLHLASLLIPHLKKQQQAAIINITSGLAYVPIAFMPVYCATKAALRSATISLRHQLRNTSVKVFEVAPPAVDTELGHQNREDKNQSHGGIPVSEFLAEAIAGLESDNYETRVGGAKRMAAAPEEMFAILNR
jgi:uncharacterized oxidoreductase